jgi:glycosyltransferase involved in cell wall biosynthesis
MIAGDPAGPPPDVSIITVTLNAAATIERTIRSVHRQKGASIEQIFVDGGSTDDTIEIIERLKRRQDYRISERDKGISDAFNKGVALARGRHIQFLNADDWLSDDQIAQALDTLNTAHADFAFGDLFFYENGIRTFRYVGEADYRRVIHRRMPVISHPTVLVSSIWFERIGLFDLSFRHAMDYDWFMRLHKAGARGAYSPNIVGHMTHEGVSNRQFRGTVEEVRRVVVSNGRNGFLASAEAQWRLRKTRLSLAVKAHARPAYDLIRTIINPAYRSTLP